MKDLTAALRKKCVLLHGGSRELRDELVSKAKNGWRLPGKTGVFTLKSGLKDDKSVLRAFARDLPITSPMGIPGDQMGLDAINDYWLEWPHERGFDAALIIWPEVQGFVRSHPEFFCNHLTHLLSYVNLYHMAAKAELRALLTSSEPIPFAIDPRSIEYDTLPPYFRASPGRSSKPLSALVETIDLGPAR